MKEARIERNNPKYQNRPDNELREKCPSNKSEIYTLPSCSDKSHTNDHHTEYRISSLELEYHIREYFRELYSRNVTYDSEEEGVYRRKPHNLHEALSSREIPFCREIESDRILIEDYPEYREDCDAKCTFSEYCRYHWKPEVTSIPCSCGKREDISTSILIKISYSIIKTQSNNRCDDKKERGKHEILELERCRIGTIKYHNR